MNSLQAGEMPQEVGRRAAPLLGGALALGAAAAGIAYLRSREIDPELRQASLLPYGEDIAEGLEGYEYAVVGGLPIDAFNEPGTVIDPQTRTITVAENFDSKLLRVTNGTVRDYDIFVLGHTERGFENLSEETTDVLKQSIKGKMARRAEQNSQPAPVVSVFPFDEKSGLFHTATLLHSDGQIVIEHGYSAKVLPKDAMQTWNLVLPGDVTLKVLDPWEQYWRSVVRFSSGIKAKDQEKLDTMLGKLRATPGLAEREDGELCEVYRTHYRDMLRGNSRNALNAEWQAPDRSWILVSQTGALVLARRILDVGQRYQWTTNLVQRLPVVFDRFVGGK